MDAFPPPPPSAASAAPGDGRPPVAEADLHAYADRRLPPARHAEVDAFLAAHPAERRRVDDWRAQNLALKRLLDPVRDEPLPLRLPLARPRAAANDAAGGRWLRGPGRSLAAGLAIAVLCGGSAWWGRGAYDGRMQREAAVAAAPTAARLPGFAHRAAVAHAVYSPDARRPVEVGADQEQALVTWLTKRLGTAVRPPDLRALGYALVGGRLLPGERGPVAQFMFERAVGGIGGIGGASGGAGGRRAEAERLTLYVTREDAGRETAFRFGQDGPVNVFYWVDRDFGYALSSGAGRPELLRVAEAVHRQLEDRK
jgi:anti-sigma factor RsiW